MNNYGGRLLYVANDGKLIIGTANPFDGCQVWKTTKEYFCEDDYKYCIKDRGNALIQGKIESIISENFDLLKTNLPTIINLLQNETSHDFVKKLDMPII